MNIGIIGTGSYLPPWTVTNKDLEGMVTGYEAKNGLSFSDWVEQVTGIRERRFAYGTTAEEMGMKAAQTAIDDAGIDPSLIDHITVQAPMARMIYPGMQCTMGELLGLPNAAGIDINAACAGSLYGLTTLWSQVARKGGYGLHISSELISPKMDFNDPKLLPTNVLFGDGAAAAVVGPVSEGGFINEYLGMDFSEDNIVVGNDNFPHKKLTVDPNDTYHIMNPLYVKPGRAVFAKAVDKLTYSIAKTFDAKPEDIKGAMRDSILVPHQANLRILDFLAKKRLGMTEDQMITIIQYTGNMSSASMLTALDVGIRDGRIKRGDHVIMPSIGGGYSYGALRMEQSYDTGHPMTGPRSC
jgi:3-oxoacyl-[acyl-carrier-protein] synthase-3